jgi:hypothetical protein
MPKKKRFLKSVDVTFISLVDKGANQKTIIYKQANKPANAPADNYQKTISIKKTDEEQHLVYGIVYSPNEVDTEGDFTNADVIKEMAHNFMKNLKITNVDKQHDFQADEGAVVESWLIKANDPTFPNDPEGSWAVAIKVVKEDTWEKIKSGEITGLSMAGIAKVEPVEETESDSLFAKMEKRFTDLFSSLKNSVVNIAKDFNSNFNNEQIRQMTWALQDSIWEVIRDEDIKDKKAAILTNVEQFKTAIGKVEFPAATDTDNSVEKAGKVFNKKNLAKLEAMKADIESMIAQVKAEAEEINKQKNNNGENDMTPEEVKNIVKAELPEVLKNAIADALKPVTESIDTMKKEFNEKAGGFEQKLETLEKASDGSFQKTITDEITKGKDEKYTGIPWIS